MIKEKQVVGLAVPLPTRIIEVRGFKVLLDADLAELYAVSTQALNQAILKRLAEIDKTLLQHDSALRDVYRKLLPLLQPPPEPPRRRIGFRQDE